MYWYLWANKQNEMCFGSQFFPSFVFLFCGNITSKAFFQKFHVILYVMNTVRFIAFIESESECSLFYLSPVHCFFTRYNHTCSF